MFQRANNIADISLRRIVQQCFQFAKRGSQGAYIYAVLGNAVELSDLSTEAAYLTKGSGNVRYLHTVMRWKVNIYYATGDGIKQAVFICGERVKVCHCIVVFWLGN